MTKQRHQSGVNNDGDDGNGRDSGNDGDGDGDGDNSAAAANWDYVDEGDRGVSRMAIGRRQLDNDNGTTTMWWRLVASKM